MKTLFAMLLLAGFAHAGTCRTTNDVSLNLTPPINLIYCHNDAGYTWLVNGVHRDNLLYGTVGGDWVKVQYLPSGESWMIPANVGAHSGSISYLRFQLTIDLYQPGQFVVVGFLGKD